MSSIEAGGSATAAGITTLGFTLAPRVVSSSPTAGATVVMTADDRDEVQDFTPAGTLATLTVTLPANATSRLGQISRVNSTQTITALTVNGAATIRNNPSTLTANNSVAFQKVASDTWQRL